MVDAINSYSGVKPQDLTINWNDCTANEVLEYKDEGQEVPTAILAWAEDMSKQQGADEVTYEMAMDNPEAVEATAQTEKLNAGESLKQNLDEQGLSLVDQAGVFRNESDTRTNNITALENEMETILQQSEAATANAEDYTTNLLSQIQTLKAQQEKLQSDKSTMFSGLQAAQIDAQIKQLGTLGLTNIETTSQQVYSSTNGISDALAAAVDATDVGNTTVGVGELLRQQSTTMNGLLGLAAQTIKSGENAIDTAKSGTSTFNSTASDNVQFEERVDANKNSVTRASGATGYVQAEEQETQEAEAEETENQTDSTEQAPADETKSPDQTAMKEDEAKQEAAKLDPTLADTSITTNPDVILRRKERKGLV